MAKRQTIPKSAAVKFDQLRTGVRKRFSNLQKLTAPAKEFSKEQAVDAVKFFKSGYGKKLERAGRFTQGKMTTALNAINPKQFGVKVIEDYVLHADPEASIYEVIEGASDIMRRKARRMGKATEKKVEKFLEDWRQPRQRDLDKFLKDLGQFASEELAYNTRMGKKAAQRKAGE